jgi:hypothetical protein
MRNTKFKNIVSMFHDYLEEEGTKIREQIDDVQVLIDVHFPPNDEPEYGYFSISLECVLTKADFDKTDFVSFGIDVDDHDGRFTMTAEIAWGFPYSKTVERVFESPVNVNDENLLKVKNRLPFMMSRLREELLYNPKGKADD